MVYFEASPAGIDALFTELDTQLTSVGNIATVLNSSTAAPPTSRLERESHYQFVGSPGDGVSSIANVGIFRFDDAGTLGLGFYGFSASLAPIAINTISQTGTTVSVTTVSAHGLATGDIVAVNGTSLTSLHDGSTSNSAPATITVTGGTTFTYTSPNTQTVGPASGGVAVPMYNLVAGRRIGGVDSYAHIILTDSAMDVMGFVDTFRICFWVKQGGNIQPVYLGTTSRTHIQDDESDVGVLAEDVGSGAVSITLNGPRPNLYSGQDIWVISADSADFERTTITGVVSDIEITATLANAYNAGALIGADAMPLCVMATDKSPTTADLETRDVFMPWHLDATRTDPISQVYFLFPELLPDPISFDPDAAGRRQATSIMVGRTTAPSGIRGRTVGQIAVPGNGPIADDIARAGDPAAAPEADYKFVEAEGTQALNPNGWAIAVGPGAV